MRKDSRHRPLWRLFFLWVALGLPAAAFAAPGDILFSDNFERAALGPWTTTSGSRSGILAGPEVSGSPTRGVFTRRNVVTVTSPTIAAAVPAAELSQRVRRGSDPYSQYPHRGENLALEYRRTNGTWATLRVYQGGDTPGEIFTETFSLPADALHGNFAVRLRQTGGSNGNFDWWHFDDVVVREALPAAPLGVGSCDDFETGLGSNWTVNSSGGLAAVTGATFQSPFSSLAVNGGVVEVTSLAVDTSDPSFGQITLWVQRGQDSFSENPDAGEDFVIEYLDDVGAWITLETFAGSGSPGQTFSRTYPIPAAGRHAGFRLRFRQVAASGPAFDFWHVDDVCFEQQPLPDLQITKIVETLTDPVNGTANPKAIPGAIVRYTIQVTNQGPGAVDADTLELVDSIPPGTALYVDAGGSDAIVFNDGTVPSGLSYSFAGDVQYSNQSGGGSPYNYTPSPDGEGFDPAVTGLRINPSGAMSAGGGGSNPSFSIQLNVRVD